MTEKEWRFKQLLQTAVRGTEHAVTTDNSKICLPKVIWRPTLIWNETRKGEMCGNCRYNHDKE